jgi:hypothetical protein
MDSVLEFVTPLVGEEVARAALLFVLGVGALVLLRALLTVLHSAFR